MKPTFNARRESASKPTVPSFADQPEDGQWTMPAKNLASTRYSGLAEINRDNVKDLQVASTFSVGTSRGQESAPIVVGDMLYVVSSFPNVLYALDLTKPGFPMKWKYNPAPATAAQGVACCDVINRGPTYADGKIIYNTLDNTTVAIDARTGTLVWQTKLGDINKGETMTMAPLVAGDKVIVGNSGGELGVRGWSSALDLKTGKLVWRAYTTGPDADVKIGPRYKPFYDTDKGKDLGVTTWPPDMWKQGGGAVWGWVSYDPELKLVYYGTSNPGPWNHEQRPGANKFTAGIFARDLETGEARWFYQYSPHDYYDHDGINENVLLDVTWEGKPRKVLVHPDRNGLVYMIDRTNGEVLSAGVYHYTNTNFGVDLKTGILRDNSAKLPKVDKVTRDICPAPPGAKDWSPSSFSPKTGFLYLPHNNLCFDERLSEVGYIEGTPYVGAEVNMKPGPGGHRGAFTAWNVTDGSVAWNIPETFPVWGGAVATAGDVVFYGTMDGWFKAVDSGSGKELWKFKTGSGIIGQPTTWKGPDGHQYVSVLDGVGGWAGAIVAGGLDPNDGSAALGFVAAMRDLPKVTTAGGTLYVFKLP
ncbi:methanol/ethanol family PQQ-dependent dehydrogenase [Methylobacterium sp. BTF04]|uniref:PQQ-dependent dehydrogenase, methanol/ethanol family n=1 Tax=Methylobacterium sp. BTF04 TaxID=2708300 RepID=UPI0013D6C63B|nr:methanol/ethanol family PQQ-dependent dehydrogenase [Methylobacterium sp. BTF04]